jgi:hypothetical protein
MAAKKRPARRTTTRKKVVTRKAVTVRPPRGKTITQKLAIKVSGRLVRIAAQHQDTLGARKDAAILRATHEGCTKCHGTGTIATHGKDGRLTGSKSCPATPTTTKVSKYQVARQARFGVDKNSGLFGWKCPCGKNEKARYRDAKTATAILRTHERKKHGGQTVGGTWYQQLPEGAKPTGKTAPAGPAATPAVTKANTGPAVTDEQWEKKNKPISPAIATKKGLCWCCGGIGALYSAFGGEQITAVCTPCQGTGKATATATGRA